MNYQVRLTSEKIKGKYTDDGEEITTTWKNVKAVTDSLRHMKAMCEIEIREDTGKITKRDDRNHQKTKGE